MDANNLQLVCTCGACPEQYDVYSAENELVGYICFRLGSLYCCSQNQNGIDFDNVVYTWDCNDGWAGVIPDDVREEVLENCKQALAKYCTEKQSEVTDITWFQSAL